MGYILDPYNPQSNDLDILNSLIRQIKIADDIFECVNNLGGRWILIFNDGKDSRLFHDATGLRQVFYTDKVINEMWCASQPGLIAEELNLRLDEDALSGFINSQQYKNNREYWWPGDSSPFKEIKHLLPNHYLDLKKKICHRYWPKKKLNYISLEEGIKKSSEILKGLMKSAFNRFDLAFAITAGWDSRVLLATSKEFNKSIFYYTLIYYDLTEESPDVKIPSKLLPQLELEHNIIRCPSHMDNEFKEIYKKNVTTAHDAWGIIAQGLYRNYPQNRVCIKANGAEILKCYYRIAPFEKLNAEKLAKLTKMYKNYFAVKHFEKWLLEAKKVEEINNIDILDLFYWEQRMGNWQAMSQLEWDIVQEVFTPFNCRGLLTTLLSTKEKYRRPPDYKLFKKLIVYLWPQVLIKPIYSGHTSIKKFLMKIHLYKFIKGVLFQFR